MSFAQSTHVYLFSYTPDGSGAFWATGVGTIDGTTITVTDAYTQIGPSYGPDFDGIDKIRTG